MVRAVDPATGETLARFETEGYVTHLVASESGRSLFAVQMDHDVVHVVASGIKLSDHGGHSDIKTGTSTLLPVVLRGSRPVHATPHHGHFIQFFDRDGEARVYEEQALMEGKSGYTVVKATAPHHGVAVPFGDYFLISEPNLAADTKADDLPPRLGLRILDKSGIPVGDIATCTGLHGEASSAGAVAFGCAEGVLLVRSNGSGAPEAMMLAYGADMPEGRVGRLLGGKAMQFFLGDYGSDKLVAIDPSNDAPYELVPLPVRWVDFALDPQRVKNAYVFTEDGHLHTLDVLSGEIVRSKRITEPYSRDGHWRDPRPRLTVMGDLIAISDPRAQLVHLIEAETFVERRTIPVEGLPFNIVAVGGSGMRHQGLSSAGVCATCPTSSCPRALLMPWRRCAPPSRDATRRESRAIPFSRPSRRN